MDFNNKAAFITGGASGLGFAIAGALAERGVNLALADIQPAALEVAANALRETGVEVLTVQADVSDREQVGAAVEATVDRYGAIDIVINNAGVGDAGSPLDSVTPEFFDWMVQVNLYGVMNVMSATVPLLKKQGRGGLILNTSSMAGLVLMPGWNQGLYSATKMAVLALSLDMRSVLERHDIGVCALCPGLVETSITQNAGRLRPSNITDALPDFPEMLQSGGMAAATAAEIAVTGLALNKAIIVTHPELWPLVETFHQTIRASFFE